MLGAEAGGSGEVAGRSAQVKSVSASVRDPISRCSKVESSRGPQGLFWPSRRYLHLCTHFVAKEKEAGQAFGCLCSSGP